MASEPCKTCGSTDGRPRWYGPPHFNEYHRGWHKPYLPAPLNVPGGGLTGNGCASGCTPCPTCSKPAEDAAGRAARTDLFIRTLEATAERVIVDPINDSRRKLIARYLRDAASIIRTHFPLAPEDAEVEKLAKRLEHHAETIESDPTDDLVEAAQALRALGREKDAAMKLSEDTRTHWAETEARAKAAEAKLLESERVCADLGVQWNAQRDARIAAEAKLAEAVEDNAELVEALLPHAVWVKGDQQSTPLNVEASVLSRGKHLGNADHLARLIQPLLERAQAAEAQVKAQREALETGLFATEDGAANIADDALDAWRNTAISLLGCKQGRETFHGPSGDERHLDDGGDTPCWGYRCKPVKEKETLKDA